MSELHIPNLTIKGFRGIKELSIESLGRVNLITGKNNTGKSSILEALRLYAHNAAPAIIYNILEFREEYSRIVDDDASTLDPDAFAHVTSLFHGFPSLFDSIEPIIITTTSDLRRPDLEMGIEWNYEQRDTEGNVRLVRTKSMGAEIVDAIPVLSVRTGLRMRVFRLDTLGSRRGRPRWGMEGDAKVPCQTVGSFGGAVTSSLVHLLDEISLTFGEDEAINALKLIDPRITAVRAVAVDRLSRVRTVKVGATHIDKPVPLRSFGDGMNHLFAIILSLLNARDGILLVDEIENGLHHSIQQDILRTIFRLTSELNVQVFATTHSNDMVKAFEEVARESPEEGIVVKLTRRGENLFATPFDEGQLTTIVGDQIEVR